MNLAKIQLEEIMDHIDPYAIKNFIISDKSVSLPPVSANFPFVIDAIIFSICIKGEARIKINFKEYEIKENTIITIMPLFVVEYLERSEDLMMEFLIFSTDFFTDVPSSASLDISKSIIQSPCLAIPPEDTERYLEFHSFIVKQYKRRDHPFRESLAKSLLFALLTEIGSIYYKMLVESKSEQETTNPKTHQDDLVYRFFQLLLRHHQTERSLQFYADKLCLTAKYLSTVVKEKTGQTAFLWINEALIASAKYHLKTSKRTILQISDDLNFPNPSFFGRFFKKHTGLTPVQYRES